MKITKEEFKEIVKDFREKSKWFDKYQDVLTEDIFCQMTDLHYKTGKYLGFPEDDETWSDILYGWNVAVSWKINEDGEFYDIEYSTDLDKIYDTYLGE